MPKKLAEGTDVIVTGKIVRYSGQPDGEYVLIQLPDGRQIATRAEHIEAVKAKKGDKE